VINENQSLTINVLEDYTSGDGTNHLAGDLLNLNGPLVYVPRNEQEVKKVNKAWCIQDGEAITVEAWRDTKDRNGVERCAGEKYIYSKHGSYLPLSSEEFKEISNSEIITEHNALMLTSDVDHLDQFGVERKAGSRWLVTSDQCSEYIVDVYQKKHSNVKRTVVPTNSYCKVRNYVDKEGVQQWGADELRIGVTTFFLQPFEILDKGIQALDILTEDEAVLLYAEKAFTDEAGVARYSGERWLFRGPGAYIPHVSVQIKERRKSTPLSAGEGIYIKDLNTGRVRAHIGSTYLLKAHEELWDKPLSADMEELYAVEKLGISYAIPVQKDGKLIYQKPDTSHYRRTKHEVMTCNVHHNKACQLFDFKTNESRVVFGPDLVMLEPEQIFTIISLSGGKPKVENAIRSFSLALGPDCMTDLVTVETSDHAVLDIHLAYDWKFIYDKENPQSEENIRLFSLKDFVGNACKSISSRIRGAISAKSYDEFHHCSAKIIKDAVFGIDKTTGHTRSRLFFENNNLEISSCDIKSIRPVDKDIELKLKQNTFLSIKIKAEATELAFTSQKDMLEQQLKGELDVQQIEDNTEAEKLRKDYYTAVAELNSISSLGVSISRAKAETEKARIEGENTVAVSQVESETLEISNNQEAEALRLQQKLKFDYENIENDIEATEQEKLADTEVNKIERMMKAIGPSTLAKIINAEPEMQQDLLKSLGLQGYLMTDGRNPINLFDTANGLVHQQAMGKM